MAKARFHSSVRAVTDDEDRLLEADEPLAQLQMRCGGILPGKISIPELFEVVRQSRTKGLRIAHEFNAFDGNEAVSGFLRVNPKQDDRTTGCELLIEDWRQESCAEIEEQELSDRLDTIDRVTAEMIVRLNQDLQVLSAESDAPDLLACMEGMRSKPLAPWSEFFTLTEAEYQQPLHWRLLDGAKARAEGSIRTWRVRLMPLGGPRKHPTGFELLLLSDQPFEKHAERPDDVPNESTLLGSVLSRVLRQPIGRIVSNAETIRARLAGPLRSEYTNYAGDIASAGSHLLALLEDLADLEDVESSNFVTTNETVDLADVAKRAASILSGKSKAKHIAVEVAAPNGTVNTPIIARAEFRRVLQILINILGNAINYSPEGSKVIVSVSGLSDAADGQGDQVTISVADQGDGLTAEQQARVFTKYERLGREGDGGSGLGLYISQRLARAMNGDLRVISKSGAGATFTLFLPTAD